MAHHFKVGDQVVWAGVPGKVIEDSKFEYALAQHLVVEFDSPAPTPGGSGKQTQRFLRDGRLLPWHKEPSLISG